MCATDWLTLRSVFSYCGCEGFPHSGSEFVCILAADFQDSVDYNFC